MKKKPKPRRPKSIARKPHNHLPTGQVVSDPVKGNFLGMPILGWVSKQQSTDLPVVMLAALLLRASNFETVGTLRMEFPIANEDAKASTLAMLAAYGWDGRVWPADAGWPTDSEEEEHVNDLLKGAGLQATLTFPPHPDRGAATLPVSVPRARGPFLMEPYAGEPGAGMENLARLNELLEDKGAMFFADPPVLCYGCGADEDLSTDGETLPLCEKCSAIAAKMTRGITYHP